MVSHRRLRLKNTRLGFLLAAFAVIFIVALTVVLVVTPSQLPKLKFFCVGVCPAQAPIAVSQVSLAPGGSIQNQYVVNTYWDITLEVNNIVNFAAIKLNSGGVNGTPLSNNVVDGSTVVPTSQIYVSLQPLQPYAWITLVPQSMTWAPAASGYDSVSGSYCGICGHAQYTATQVTTQPQSTTFYEMTGPWHFVYPVEITVTKTGSQSFSESQIVNAAQTNTTTIYSPFNSSEYVTINSLGLFKGSLSDPQIGQDMLFLPPQGQNGMGQPVCPDWCAFGNAPSTAIQQGYPQYWFGPSTSFDESGGQASQTPLSTYRPNGAACPSATQGYPGWAQTVGYGYGSATKPSSYPSPYDPGSSQKVWFYDPITPSLTTPQSAYSNTTQFYENQQQFYYGAYINRSICPGLDLVDWLFATGHGANPWNYYGLTNWGNITTQKLTLNLPGGQNSPGYPVMQVLISSALADTVVFQVNNAQFKFTGLTASVSNIYATQTATITATIQDTSSFGGTANVGYYQTNHVIDSEPPTQSINLAAGQTGSVSFTVTGLQLSRMTNDTLTYYVENSAGQITDSRSITIEVNPQPSAGSKIFVIDSVSGPPSLQAGQQGKLTISITSLGVAGTAYLSASSESQVVAQVAPPQLNQSMGAGNTVEDQFNIVAGEPAQNTNVTLDISVSNGTYALTDKYTLVVYAANSTSPSSSYPIGSSGLPLVEYLGIGLVAAAVIALVYVAVVKKKKASNQA